MVSQHFSVLFPSIPFLITRSFLSHRLTRGRRHAPHSAWEPSALLFSPANHHRHILEYLRSHTLDSPTTFPCFYRLVASVGATPMSLFQSRDPVMLIISPHVRAEITLASHASDTRLLPHPDHGRLPAPYLYASIGASHPEHGIRSLEQLIASGSLNEPWSFFFMDHRRRLFHGVWLLPALPTHHSHCLYIATTATPDDLRLLLDGIPTLTLSPLRRHPILDLQNLDHTSLGMLLKALQSPPIKLVHPTITSLTLPSAIGLLFCPRDHTLMCWV